MPTTMKVGMWDYIKAAFNARPIGMFVAPNWVGLALFALLGWWNPAFLLIGAGLELAYLYALSTNKRFQRYVSGRRDGRGGAGHAAEARSDARGADADAPAAVPRVGGPLPRDPVAAAAGRNGGRGGRRTCRPRSARRAKASAGC
jgi:hypothetical protein